MRTIGLFVRSIVVTGVVATAAPAGAQQPAAGPAKLVLGIYCPNARFGGSGARFGYINRLARHVAKITGIPTSGRAFGSAGSFGSALSTLDFAVVDPVYLCRRAGRFRVLLTGRLGGGARASWALFARSAAGGVMGLKGKRLIVAQAAGAETSFAEGLFSGQIAVGKFFSAVRRAPDLASAVSAVRGGSADAVFAPAGMGRGLKRIYGAGTVPNAGFVLVRRSLSGSVVSKVRSAVVGYGASGVGGWGGGSAYRCRFGRRRYTMAVSRPRPVRFSGQGVVNLRLDVQYRLPEIKKYFWDPGTAVQK